MHHYSVGLSVARDPELMQLHCLAAELLQINQIQILNPCLELYQPHLTLAGICWKPSTPVLLDPILDGLISLPLPSFHLKLACGDDIGQYLETLFELQI